MHKELSNIRNLTRLIVDSDASVTSVEVGINVMELSLALRRISESIPRFAKFKRVNEPSETSTGVALGLWHASLSMEDRPRTAAFLRGLSQALSSELESYPSRPIHLVEAGCGPLAGLSIPMMTLFEPDQLQVTLVDLHDESIEVAEELVRSLGLTDYLKQAICANLLNYEFENPADVVVLETMDAALNREPQVSLMRRLVNVFPDALILPESITIDLQSLNFTHVGFPMTVESLDRKHIGRVFELDRQSAIGLEEKDGTLPAARLRVPEDLSAEEQLVLMTQVKVFREVVLQHLEAQITAPVPIVDFQPGWLGAELEFRYRIGRSPGLEWTCG